MTTTNDDVVSNPGVGGARWAADYVFRVADGVYVYHPRTKISLGRDDYAQDLPNAPAQKAESLPVALCTQDRELMVAVLSELRTMTELLHKGFGLRLGLEALRREGARTTQREY